MVVFNFGAVRRGRRTRGLTMADDFDAGTGNECVKDDAEGVQRSFDIFSLCVRAVVRIILASLPSSREACLCGGFACRK